MVQIHVIEGRSEHATGEKKQQDGPGLEMGWWTGAESSWEARQGRATPRDEDKKSGETRPPRPSAAPDPRLPLRAARAGPLLVLPEYGYEKDYFEDLPPQPRGVEPDPLH